MVPRFTSRLVFCTIKGTRGLLRLSVNLGYEEDLKYEDALKYDNNIEYGDNLKCADKIILKAILNLKIS